MNDARQIMRAMLLGLAPVEHRALSVAELQRLGYPASTAEALAQNLDCIVLAASQLNRASKDSAVPTLRALRDSGEVEQDADGVALLHRPDHDDDNATAQLLIAKNRWGELASIELVPDLANHRFGWGF